MDQRGDHGRDGRHGKLYAGDVVLDLASDGWTAERWTGGLDLTFPATGAVVRLVFWHSAFHVTEDGDVAPGFGLFRARIDEREEGH